MCIEGQTVQFWFPSNVCVCVYLCFVYKCKVVYIFIVFFRSLLLFINYIHIYITVVVVVVYATLTYCNLLHYMFFISSTFFLYIFFIPRLESFLLFRMTTKFYDFFFHIFFSSFSFLVSLLPYSSLFNRCVSRVFFCLIIV